jgi:tetratricopeptide (TPR) repeat protein
MVAAVRAVVLAALLAGCAARQTTNVDRLIARLGVDQARAELKFRVASEPDDLDARRALALLEDANHRPSAAIEHLLVVEAVGGPLGTRWTADDRDRLARLLVGRATERLRRGWLGAEADLAHARRLGAAIEPTIERMAKLARAEAEMREADGKVRARGIASYRTLVGEADPRILGTSAWQLGARRAAFELLEAWHATGGYDPSAQLDLGRAQRWWSLPGAAPFDADERDAALARGHAAVPPAAGAEAPVSPCLPVLDAPDAICSAPLAVADPDPRGPAWQADLVAASQRWERTRDPEVAAAWVVVLLRDRLAHAPRPPWLAAIRARVDVGAVADAAPAWARPTLLRAAGRPADATAALRAALHDDLPPAARQVLAAELAMTGASEAEVAAIDPALAPTAPPAAAVPPTLAAAISYLTSIPAAAVDEVRAAYRRDPGAGDRRLAELIDAQPDAVVGIVAGAYLFQATGDLGRARALWQRAVDLTADPTLVLRLALVAAHMGDGDAALVHLTRAAAASGDPAPVFVQGARALLAGDSAHNAIEAAKEAIDLAGPDAIADALTVAADASTAAGRAAQAAGLLARRDALVTPLLPDPADPTDAVAAARTPEALAIAARWNPRDVESRRVLAALPDADPRAHRARRELIQIALDGDAGATYAALQALAAIK